MNKGPRRGRKPFLPAFAWVTYDFANTMFSMFVGSMALPLYLRNLTGRDVYMGCGNMVSQLMAAVIGPAAGAVADRTGRNARYMKIATAASIAFTAMLAASSSALWLVVVFVLANMTYNVALPFYNALLRRVVPPSRRGFLSGLGVAAGNLGAAFVVLAIQPIVAGTGNYGKGFLATAGWFALFALPAFLFLRDGEGASATSLRAAVAGWRSSLVTWAKLPGLGAFRNFLIARFLYEEATNTVIVFMSVLAVHYAGVPEAKLGPVYMALIGSAVAGSLLSAFLVDRVGAKRVVTGVLLLWFAALGLALFLSGTTGYLIFGCLAGVALGGLSSADRPLLIELTPPEKTAEYFGFHALSGKISASFGPVIFALVSDRLGYRAGITVLLAFFAAALAALAFVRVGRVAVGPRRVLS